MAVDMEKTPISSFFGGRDRSGGGDEPKVVMVKRRQEPRREEAEPEPEEDDTGSETLDADAPEPESEEEGGENLSGGDEGEDGEPDESGEVDLDQTTDAGALRSEAKKLAARIKRMDMARRKAMSEAGKREQTLRNEMKADMDKLHAQVQAFMQGGNRDTSTAVTADEDFPELEGGDDDFLTVGQAKKLQDKAKRQKQDVENRRTMAKRWLDAEAQELQSLPGAKDYLDFAGKELESDGKLGKLQFSAAKVLYVMQKKHEKDLTSVKDAEYKRGLKDGERKLRRDAEKLGRLPPTAEQRSSVQTRSKQQDQDASKDPNRLVRMMAQTGQKYGLPPIRIQSKGA